MKFDFLKPENIRDADKRKPGEADYNPHTLFVPAEFKKNLTPVRLKFLHY